MALRIGESAAQKITLRVAATRAAMSRILRDMRQITSAMLVNIYAVFVTTVVQLVSVPLYLSFWSPTTYGKWLLISTIPAYISMADFGVTGAAGNQMTIACEAGRSDKANEIFQSAFLFVLFSCLIITLLVATISGIAVQNGWLDSDLGIPIVFLAITALLNILCALIESVFRASSQYVFGNALLNSGRLFEWCGSLVGLLISATVLSAALGMLVARLLFLLLFSIVAIRRAKIFKWNFRNSSLEKLRELVAPSLGFFAFPLSYALSLQATTLVIGALLGPASVATFNSVRTLSRVPIQLMGVLCRSIWPRISGLYGAGKLDELRSLVRSAWYVGMLGCLTVGVAISAGSESLVAWWTHGHISVSPLLVAVFVLSALISCGAQPPSMVLLATNKHARYGLAFLVNSVALVGVTTVLASQFGISGVAFSYVVFEAINAYVIFILLRKEIFGSRVEANVLS